LKAQQKHNFYNPDKLIAKTVVAAPKVDVAKLQALQAATRQKELEAKQRE
jgi:hypothetical protein